MPGDSLRPSLPVVRVVVLAYGDEPFLREAVDSALASQRVDVHVVVVDNGAAPASIAAMPDDPRLTLITAEENLGFAGGVNRGAAGMTEEFLALLNSDAEFAPDALAELVAVASRPSVGIASGSIRLYDSPELINSAGNPIHIVGLCWAGGLDEPAARYAVEKPITSASGAGLAMRREWWERLGGFPPEYFAYHEDVDISWRTWMLGREVIYVPTAVVLHHYEFSRNPNKMYLLERNREIFLKTLYGPRLRAATWLPVRLFDVAMGLLASRQGWGAEKKRARAWVRANGAFIRSKREEVEQARFESDRRMARLLTATLDPVAVTLPPGSGVLQALLKGYWAIARRFV